MSLPELNDVASAVLRRAQQNGYVVPRDVRAALAAAGQPESLWKEVLGLLRESLNYRQGRYYLLAAPSPKLREQQDEQQAVRRAVADLIERHRSHERPADRRQEGRVAFPHAVRVRTEDGQEFRVLGRDLSPSGIRFISHRSLLGRKVRLDLPPPGETGSPVPLVTRVLWTTAVADGLYENGGNFLSVASG